MNGGGLKYLTQHGLKRLAISAGLELANVLRMLSVGNKARGSGTIFTLHHVQQGATPARSFNAHLSITPDFLDSAIRTVIGEGYEIIPLSAVPQRLAEGGAPFAVFTMDDGYRDNAAEALPVFSRHNAPFTVFATRGLTMRTHTIWWETLDALVSLKREFRYDFGSGPITLRCDDWTDQTATHQAIAHHIVGTQEDAAIEQLNKVALENGIDPLEIVDRQVMTESELAEFSANPLVSIGAHTVSHRAVSFLPEAEARREMLESADFVETVTGARPTTFAYPYGFSKAVSQRDHRLAAECGFDLAVTTQPGTLSAGSLHALHALPRVSLNGLYQRARYVSALASGLPFGPTNEYRNRVDAC